MVVTAQLAGSVVGLWELVDKAKVGHGQADSEVSGRFMCRQSAVVNGPSGNGVSRNWRSMWRRSPIETA